jgi:prevent-host-death family protein
MKQIPATQFKARCMRLLDEVAETGEPLVITKRGRPVARLEPLVRAADLRGSAKVHLADEEFVHASIGVWDVARE